MNSLARNWIRILLGALLVRLAIAPWFHGFNYDMYIYGNWAETLHSHPFREFYEHADSPDHLPGDLYIHWILAGVFQLFGADDLYGAPYRYLLKAFPAIIDILTAGLIWRLLRDRVGEQVARLAAIAFAANPAIIFLSSVWGQWDVVSGAIFLTGLILLWQPSPRPILAAALFGWALLIKPPLMLLVIFAVIGFAWRSYREAVSPSKVLLSLVGMMLSALATVTLLMLPFRMSWLDGWARYSLVDRLQMAADLYPNTTLGAANFWMVFLRRLDRVPDSSTFLGLSYQAWGMVMLAVACAIVAWRSWRGNMTGPWLIWAMATASYAYFLLPTRSHERYLFPAILMLIVLAGFMGHARKLWSLAAAASAVYLVNLIFVYAPVGGLTESVIFTVLSMTNIAVFISLIAIPREEIDQPLAS